MVPPPQRDRWLPYRNASPRARRRLFCLPHAGGAASLFRDWRAVLAESTELCALQLPGRETRIAEPPRTRLADLVPELVSGIRNHLDMPFAIFGHSNGAVIAFELVRQLRREQLPLPVLLIVSSHRAPHQADPGPTRHQLTDDDLVADLRRLNGTPAALFDHPDIMRLLLAVYRADLELCETRVVEPPDSLPVPIAAYGGEDDPEVSPSDLDAWREQTSGAFRRRIFRGGHFYLKSRARDVLESLDADLTLAGSLSGQPLVP